MKTGEKARKTGLRPVLSEKGDNVGDTGMEAGVRNLLNGLIDGTIQDLDGPVRAAAARLSAVASDPTLDPVMREQLIAEVRDQLAVLMLQKKIVLKAAGGGFVSGVLSVGLGALVDGAIAGLNGAKV